MSQENTQNWQALVEWICALPIEPEVGLGLTVLLDEFIQRGEQAGQGALISNQERAMMQLFRTAQRNGHPTPGQSALHQALYGYVELIYDLHLSLSEAQAAAEMLRQHWSGRWMQRDASLSRGVSLSH